MTFWSSRGLLLLALDEQDKTPCRYKHCSIKRQERREFVDASYNHDADPYFLIDRVSVADAELRPCTCAPRSCLRAATCVQQYIL